MPHFPKPFFKKSRGLWYVELNRRQVNLGPDRDAAFAQYYTLMGDASKTARLSNDSLAVIVDNFLEWHTRNRSSATFRDYRHRLQSFVTKYPTLKAREVKPYHVEGWANQFPEHSITTRRNYLRAVKRCLRWAHQQGYIRENPIVNLEVPSAGRKERVATEADYELYCQHICNPSLLDLFQLTWETGCRPQESLRVEVRHVDLENRRWVFPQNEAKGKRNVRVVYLSELATQITQRCVLQVREGHIFRNTNGKPWNSESVNCAVDATRIRIGKRTLSPELIAVSESEVSAAIEASSSSVGRSTTRNRLIKQRIFEHIPRVSLYSLRHAWATRALRNGVDPLTVAILMGHKDPSMLSRVYQHLSLDPSHMLAQAQRARA